jgi:Flp pilus assembly pilin Flp
MDRAGRVSGFAADESGAITVDWVVLTALVIALGVAAFTQVGGGVMTVADDIAHVMGTHIHPTGNHYQ